MNYFDTTQQATAHFCALQLVAHADGGLQPNEELFLANLLAVYKQHDRDLSHLKVLSSPGELPAIDDVLLELRTRKQKLMFLQDLYSMATLSGNVESEELPVIEKIASALEVSQDDMGELGALNADVIEANKRLACFIFSEDVKN